MTLWMSMFVSCGTQIPLFSVSIPEASAADTGWPDWAEEDPEEPAPEAPVAPTPEPEVPIPEPDHPTDPTM